PFFQFSLSFLPPPRSILFPYTTLFRSLNLIEIEVSSLFLFIAQPITISPYRFQWNIGQFFSKPFNKIVNSTITSKVILTPDFDEEFLPGECSVYIFGKQQ